MVGFVGVLRSSDCLLVTVRSKYCCEAGGVLVVFLRALLVFFACFTCGLTSVFVRCFPLG